MKGVIHTQTGKMVYYQKCLFLSKYIDGTYIRKTRKNTHKHWTVQTTHTQTHTQPWSLVERLCKLSDTVNLQSGQKEGV